MKIPKNKEVEKVTREVLRERFPLYKEEDLVVVLNPLTSDQTLVEYDSSLASFRKLFFWKQDHSYLGNIILSGEKRGKGMGWKLYESVFEITSRFGLEMVTQIPSGLIVIDGKIIESREEYLLRKGCVKSYNGQVYKRTR